MTDPKRIDLTLRKLGELWALQPDFRFGLLVRSLPPKGEGIDFSNAGMTRLAVFEDERWEKWIDGALAKAKSKKVEPG